MLQIVYSDKTPALLGAPFPLRFDHVATELSQKQPELLLRSGKCSVISLGLASSV